MQFEIIHSRRALTHTHTHTHTQYIHARKHAVWNHTFQKSVDTHTHTHPYTQSMQESLWIEIIHSRRALKEALEVTVKLSPARHRSLLSLRWDPPLTLRQASRFEGLLRGCSWSWSTCPCRACCGATNLSEDRSKRGSQTWKVPQAYQSVQKDRFLFFPTT